MRQKLISTRLKFLLFGLGISLLFTSCYIAPVFVKKHFTTCYTGESTGLDSMINLKGTYETMEVYWNTTGYGSTYHPRWDTFHLDMILFKDGIGLFNLCSSNKRKALNALADSSIVVEPCGSIEGVYTIVSDTIKLQLSNDNTWGWATWVTAEPWFKITSRNTLLYLGEYEKEKGLVMDHPAKGKDNVYTFYPTKTLPSEDIWLKKKKWFWCKNRK